MSQFIPALHGLSDVALKQANFRTFSPCPVYREEMGEDGPYTATSFTVEAVNEYGEAYRHHRHDLTEDQAADLVERIQFAIADGQHINPAESDYWFFSRRIYGGESYQYNQHEEEHDRQRADVEAEDGPGAYGYNHPGYLGRR